MFRTICNFIAGLFSPRPVRLAIVRRYADARGSYVGELYLEQEQGGVSSFRMIGASLDTLTLDYKGGPMGELLDTRHDFLAFMPRFTVRVGALDPRENDKVREMVSRLPRRNMTLVVQNRFIEFVLDKHTPKSL